MTGFTLFDLEDIVDDRLANGDATSYTRKLAAKGMPKAAQKVGEEAVEAVIAAVSGDRKGLASETADLLYHLIVVLRLAGVPLSDVMAELAARTGRSGLEEKAARPKE
ncbi:phosphoribosyl-ATP diphosphatase [Oharaeibacter diazotrophicus]|uniref:Phosphoribosyl-ATP pyrophosphatase n=1 Tax=Oharaeibacter diazotrophicus TaxID=1920512 RepID=A0A4R6R7E0_9HYPH|nr:phosphoribosyl-ATP diphosphatase [Oharaeibacter diazotrophicus]TDP81477.1 phosphoribosyl-ATP pyrophosphatase [Oharaeibacter diazotrophicus]BBE73715.1 phosphoribosyl-ATP pyrophosphatase [Pleomorphomonas sp. SM30]GLS75504.1 phosphoribosyl-ATP pyrophosphatase [Oharaeibacter diazotrophicus]